MSLGKWKLEQQRSDTPTYLLEWPKSVTLTANAGKDVEEQEFSPLMAMQNSKATLEESLAVLQN